MARIVIGWELGGNSGHARRIGALAARLAAEGHALHLAVQDPAALARALPEPLAARVTLWQAPLWSGLLRHGGTRPLGAPRRFGDALANLGLQDAGMLAGVLAAWDSLLGAIRPEAAIADFAPGLLLAARGRMPRLCVGTGFTVPPAHLPEFPPFPGAPATPLVAEAALLGLVNAALARGRRPGLAALPETMHAEAALPAVFAELDPYAALRPEPPLAPFLPAALPGDDAPAAPAPAVFAYLPAGDLGPEGAARLAALAARLPVTAVIPGLDPARRAGLRSAGVGLAAGPLGWADIRRRHSLVLTSGGIGTVSSALVSGLALHVIPAGVEQALTLRALVAAGLAAAPGPDPAGAIEAAARDPALAAAARGRAAGFRARLSDPAQAVAARLDALLR